MARSCVIQNTCVCRAVYCSVVAVCNKSNVCGFAVLFSAAVLGDVTKFKI